MKAAVVTGSKHLEIMEVPEPSITKNTEIKIQVVSAAICNTTDNKVYATDFPERHWPYHRFPFILGHECSGRIVERGEAVSDLEIGDRIVYWTVPGGAFADYLLIDTAESAVARLSEEVPNETSAIMEMVIGCARLLVDESGRSFVEKGSKAAVFGLGPAGLIYHRLLRLLGVEKICGVGHRPFRLRKAIEVGADGAVSSEKAAYQETVIEVLGGRPDIIVDATGADIITEAVHLSAPHGRLIPYGIPPFDWNDKLAQISRASMKLPEFAGLQSARMAIKACTRWASEQLLGLEPVITHRITFSDIARGLDMCRVQRDSTLKVVIEVN